MAEIEKKWYVLRAISGKEAKVKEMCIRDRVAVFYYFIIFWEIISRIKVVDC